VIAAALREAIEAAVARATGVPFRVERVADVGGGCIHRAFAAEGGGRRYFVKSNAARFAASFAAEADGLVALRAAGIRAPEPIAHGVGGDSAFLVLEHLDLGTGTTASYRELGRRLARLHGKRGARFGWHRDNFIGLTPQSNQASDSWAAFWRDRRLAPQLAAAARGGHGARLQRLGERVLAELPRLLAGHDPAPALLHGDLWHGNAGFLAGGTPVVFDPAVYYGDAEADLAMTELFGGFPVSFYEGYREVRAVPEGYPMRRILYNLYHVLNHLNLFGEGYRAQAERMMERLLDSAATGGCVR
jgi:fructosamine-3-kinase